MSNRLASPIKAYATPLVLLALTASTGYLLLERPVKEVTVTETKEVEVPVTKEVTVYVDSATKKPIPAAQAEATLRAQKVDPSTGLPAPEAVEFESRLRDPNEKVTVLRDWSKQAGDRSESGYEWHYDHGWKVVDVYGTPCILYLRGDLWHEDEQGPTMDCLENSS